ncbi:MAG TPA: 2,3-bisphosphoglycerate-dependent phosphoglycerate mutase [Candidatus Limnocylindrales bacterium]|nr:2,3-bisphosphoglycerate-dependent phosphoglycerate mutase [Candidatus Limnocylindrales bacterium]
MKKKLHFVQNLDSLDIHNENYLSQSSVNLLKIKSLDLPVPEGFIIVPDAYADFLSRDNLSKKITDLLSTIHYERPDSLMQVSNHIKGLISSASLSDAFVTEVTNEYKKMNSTFQSAKVTVGGNEKVIKSIKDLLPTIKSIWVAKFEPSKLLYNHKHHIDSLEKVEAITVLKIINSNKKGSIITSSSEITTNSKLSSNEIKKIQNLASVLKKHFYLPHLASWVIDKNLLYIVKLKPMTNAQQSSLVLIRHGQSEWNAKGLWTGWSDPSLSELGRKQADEAGKMLKDIHFDVAYTSALLRAVQTLNHIKKAKNQPKIPTVSHKALNERDYGALTGKNKWEVEKEFGEKQFLKWRRGWDEPIPHGESLKDVYERVVPYFKDNILPKLKSGKNIIIAAHGNSLRALVKYLENISDSEISKLEIPVGQIHVYKIDEDGNIVGKEIRNQETDKL